MVPGAMPCARDLMSRRSSAPIGTAGQRWDPSGRCKARPSSREADRVRLAVAVGCGHSRFPIGARRGHDERMVRRDGPDGSANPARTGGAGMGEQSVIG